MAVLSERKSNRCPFRQRRGCPDFSPSTNRDLLATSKGGGAVLDRIMVIVGSIFDGEDNDAMAQGNFTSDIFGLA